jgi:hypothetical protein
MSLTKIGLTELFNPLLDLQRFIGHSRTLAAGADVLTTGAPVTDTIHGLRFKDNRRKNSLFGHGSLPATR